jgi:hypothetical protein
MSLVKVVTARYREAGERLRLGPAIPEERASEALPKMKLMAKSRGDLQSATLSAAYYAKKLNQTMYIYAGTSYGSGVWRVSYKPSEYLNGINNSGSVVYTVTPELTVSRHTVLR